MNFLLNRRLPSLSKKNTPNDSHFIENFFVSGEIQVMDAETFAYKDLQHMPYEIRRETEEYGCQGVQEAVKRNIDDRNKDEAEDEFSRTDELFDLLVKKK